MINNIKQTEEWNRLLSNPKFEQMIEKYLNKYPYYTGINDLYFKIDSGKLIVIYNSKIKNRDLDCQYKIFEQAEFFLDDDNSLIINELSGRLESKYGYSFNNTMGGIVKTHYSCQVFDNEGIEMDYQCYSDKYQFDQIAFNSFKDDLFNVMIGAYNPHLVSVIYTDEIPKPNIIGKNSRYLRYNRSKDNLGIVDVIKESFLSKNDENPINEEYFFNTFFTSSSKNEPELIHFFSGFPFATIEDNKLKIENDYVCLGLTENNYQDFARNRFLKELNNEIESIQNNPEILEKYNLMISKLKNEKVMKKRIH